MTQTLSLNCSQKEQTCSKSRLIWGQVYYSLAMVLVPTIMVIAGIFAGKDFSISSILIWTYVFLFAGVMLILGRKAFSGEFKLTKEWVTKVFACYGGFYVIAKLLEVAASLLASNFGASTSANQAVFMDVINASPVVMGFISGILGPVIEELVFRFALYNSFKNKKVALVVTTITFAMMHISSLAITELFFIPVYLIMGYILTKLYEKTGDIRLTTAVHILNNSMEVLTSLI